MARKGHEFKKTFPNLYPTLNLFKIKFEKNNQLFYSLLFHSVVYTTFNKFEKLQNDKVPMLTYRAQ